MYINLSYNFTDMVYDNILASEKVHAGVLQGFRVTQFATNSQVIPNMRQCVGVYICTYIHTHAHTLMYVYIYVYVNVCVNVNEREKMQ